MAINLNIADAVLTQTSETTTPTVSISAPNNVVEDDIILICASITAGNSSDGWDFGNLPTGFTNLRDADNTSTFTPDTAIFAKVATASEPASYNFGILDARDVAAYALRVSGVDTANISANSEIASTTSGTSLTFSGGDSTTSGNVIIYATALGDFDSPSSNQGLAITPPAGVTKQLEFQGGSVESDAQRLNLAVSSEDAVTETIGTREFTWTNSDNALGVWVELNEAQATFENTSPVDGATGVSVTPTLEINNPDNFTDLNYRVATSSNVDADVIRDIFNQADTASVTEALSASTQYHWNARDYTPGGQVVAYLLQETFTASDEWDDWVEEDLTGTNTLSVTGGEGVITSDPSSQVGVAYDADWGNVEITMTARFSDVTSSQQPTIHFRAQGTTWIGNFLPSYYLYFLGNELRIGRIDSNGNASDFSGQSVTFSRSADTNYDIRILVEDYRIRVAIWASSGSQNGWQFDYVDSSNRFLTGGIAIKNTADGGGSTTITVDDIEVIGAEFVDETQAVDSVSVDPSTASVEGGSTVTVEGTIQTSGGLSNAGTWTKESGVAGITIQSTSGNNVVIAVDNTITDNDTAVFRLTADEDNTKFAETTVTAVEAVTGAYQDSEQGDRDALQALYDATDGANWTNTWSTSTITSGDLSTLYGVTADTINGEQRVTSIKLNGSTGINTSTWVGDDGVNGGNNIEGELPDDLGNLKECKYFNVKQNALFGQLPQGVFEMSGAIRILLNGQREDYTLTSNINMNKTGSSQNSQRSNNFTGQLPASANVPNLEFLELAGQGKIDVNDGTGTGNLSGGLPDWLANTNLKGLILSFNQISSWNTSIQNLDLYQFYFHGNAMAGQGMPTWFSNFTNMRCMDIEGNALGGAVADLSTWTNIRFVWSQRNEFTSGFPIDLLRGTSAGIINMLEFAWNNFDITDLGFIDRCPRLTAFTIDGNDFDGDIHPSWGTKTPRLSNWGLGWNNFSTVPYDLTESTNRRYIRLRNNSNLQVASPDTGLPVINSTLDNDGWNGDSLDWRDCNFNGTITQEAIDAIVFNVENNGLDYINISGNSFTSGELQPLIDALSGFSITFLYGNQTP